MTARLYAQKKKITEQTRIVQYWFVATMEFLEAP